jgi:hypothetical protein
MKLRASQSLYRLKIKGFNAAQWLHRFEMKGFKVTKSLQ